MVLTLGVVLGELSLGRVLEWHLELHDWVFVHLPLHPRCRVGLEAVPQGPRFFEPEQERARGHVGVRQEPLVDVLRCGEAQSLKVREPEQWEGNR